MVGKTKPKRRKEWGYWQNETKATNGIGLSAKQNQRVCPISAPDMRSSSLQDDPALDAGTQCADPLDVFDHFAGDRRRISVGARRRDVREHRIAVAAAGEKVVGGDAIGALLVERHIANLDRGDATAGRPFEVSLD